MVTRQQNDKRRRWIFVQRGGDDSQQTGRSHRAGQSPAGVRRYQARLIGRLAGLRARDVPVGQGHRSRVGLSLQPIPVPVSKLTGCDDTAAEARM